ncbi:hypothetical protein [Erythrobacter sp.]|uniref:hypothetical protein n=1 Tax=Erythrobacter sp. TaxID=1042 RepID=UPI003C76DA7A
MPVRLATAAWAASRAYALHAAVVFVACVGVWFVQRQHFLVGDDRWRHPVMLVAIVLLLLPVRSRDVARPLLVTHRTVFLLFTAYWLVSYPAVSEAYWQGDPYHRFLYVEARWVAVAAGVLGWFRPAFGVVPVVLMAWKKHLMAAQFGFPLNATDYYPVAELSLFLTFAVLTAAAGAALVRRFDPPRGWKPATDWSLGEAAFLGAFAIHMANYVYSAVAKMTLPGAGPLTWIFENRTHDIMLATWSIGLGPLHGAGPFALGAHEFMAGLTIPINAITVIAQLAGVLALWRIRWGMAITGLYDVLHVIVFVTTSILFWKWMTLNVGLLVALRYLLPRRAPPWPLAIMATGVLILSPLIFRVAWLGWFDTGTLNKVTVEAELADGRRVEVPNVYFLEGSAQMSKSVIGAPFEGHFDDIGVFGKAERGYRQMLRANRCELETADTSGLSRSFERNPRLERYFRRHHDFIMSKAGRDGRFDTWFFPHHNWANPALYHEFARIDLANIRAYHYNVESICFSYDGNGGVDERVQLKGSHEIRVD